MFYRKRNNLSLQRMEREAKADSKKLKRGNRISGSFAAAVALFWFFRSSVKQ